MKYYKHNKKMKILMELYTNSTVIVDTNNPVQRYYWSMALSLFLFSPYINPTLFSDLIWSSTEMGSDENYTDSSKNKGENI